MTGSAALGWGWTLPGRVVSNADLAVPLETTAEAILAETGIAERRWVEAGQAPSDLAVGASRDALAAAGRAVGDVDMIVFATTTPDIAFPGAGCFLQDKLGCATIGALDMRAQCAGFPYGLATADRFVRAGKARCVLLATGEVHSTSLERAPRGRGVTPWFGDGAAVVVVGAADDGSGVLATVLHNDPAGYRRFWIEYPASQHSPARMDRPAFEQGRHFPVVDAAALSEDAERRLVDVAQETLAAADVAVEAVDLAVLHYLDSRVARRAGERLGLVPEAVVTPAASFGHVASAGPAMAITEAIASGRIGPGALVLVAAVGAGIAWGGAVLRL